MNQNSWEILETRRARQRNAGDTKTSLAQWHQGIGGHGYVKLGVSQGVHFNLFAALRQLNNSIANPQPHRAVRVKPAAPVRVGLGGAVVHERRDASGILLPTARQRRYTPLPLTPFIGKALNIGFDGKRMD